MLSTGSKGCAYLGQRKSGGGYITPSHVIIVVPGRLPNDKTSNTTNYGRPKAGENKLERSRNQANHRSRYKKDPLTSDTSRSTIAGREPAGAPAFDSRASASEASLPGPLPTSCSLFPRPSPFPPRCLARRRPNSPELQSLSMLAPPGSGGLRRKVLVAAG